MTIVISYPSNEFIIMLSDSAITEEHPQDDGKVYYEYSTASKTISYPGVGFITRWGDNIHYPLRTHLEQYNILQNRPSVSQLAAFVKQYLDGYSSQHPDDELGFHVAGFENGRPKRFHVFWAFNQPRREELKAVHCLDHSEESLLFNGRNDLAGMAINALMREGWSGREVRFDISTPIGRILLCDFVARFAAEITPQVGPPFEINLIFPDNTVERIVNPSLAPISLYNTQPILEKILCRPSSIHIRSMTFEPPPYDPSQIAIGGGGTVALLPKKSIR